MNKLLIPLLIINTSLITLITPVCGQLVTVSGRGRTVGVSKPVPAAVGNALPDRNRDTLINNSIIESPSELMDNQAIITPAALPKSLYLPVDGALVITSPYGERYHPVLHRELYHSGVDIRARFTGVRSVADGVVVRQGSDSRSGRYMVIQHQNGVESIYCHLKRFIRHTGDTVLAGCVIAISGKSGAATAPHLHFGLKLNGKYVNPLPFLKAVRAESEQLYSANQAFH